MSKLFNRLFRDHPREVEESYLVHMGASSAYGLRLLKASMAAFAHAIVPGVHKTTASACVREMAHELTCRADMARESRMRDAGAIDPGL